MPHEDKRAEFFDHVWNHTTDPFFKSFSIPREITTEQRKTFKAIIKILCEDDDRVACDKIYQILKTSDPRTGLIPLILQMIGSTRNKILTDLRALLHGTGIAIPRTPEGLAKNHELLHHAEKYMSDDLRRVFSALIEKKRFVDDDALDVILDILNQSTWPGYARQERAKRSGHHAEWMIAKSLSLSAIPFEPQSKIRQPLSGDVQYRGISYDIVIPSDVNPLICIKSTVHTSNIGQYGESKDALEMKLARESLVNPDKQGERSCPLDTPLLVAFVDGVGFKSNVVGLDGIFDNADEFVQFATMWKLHVLAARVLGRHAELWIPDPHRRRDFLDRYAHCVNVLTHRRDGTWQAGEGAVALI